MQVTGETRPAAKLASKKHLKSDSSGAFKSKEPRISHYVQSGTAYNKMLKLPQCPWGRGKNALEPAHMTGPQKKWIADAVILNKYTGLQMAERFTLNHWTINNWVKTVQKGGNIDRKGGRPPKIAPVYLQSMCAHWRF
jgi:hypothetical protein